MTSVDQEHVVEIVVADRDRRRDTQGLDDLRHGIRVADDEDVALARLELLDELRRRSWT